ncbi:MAG: hypothetical protein J4F98_15725, partial [Acidobacteria bacterium]|nr:hypothetical protein [Acidobacteriota bacterium]
MTKTQKPRRLLAFLKWTGISVAALAGLVLVLNLTTGMRLQMTGNFMPKLDFHHEDRHYRAIEAHRDQAEAPALAQAAEPEAVTATPSASSWPYYRGLNMDGRYPEPINTVWPSGGPPELWRIPVGGGYASFVVGD